MRVLTAGQMGELDRRTIRDLRVPGVVLMENAGLRAADVLVEAFDLAPGDRVHIWAGKGNNGGDGFVVARHLANRDLAVEVYLFAPASSLRGDALTNFKSCMNFGVPVREITSIEDFETRRDEALEAAVIVDALLGTGLRGPARGLVGRAIEALAAAARRVLALDIPSGIGSDTGEVLGPHVIAEVTVTFGAPKIGHLVFPAAAATGRLFLVDISIPPRLIEASGAETFALDGSGLTWPGPSGRDLHKGRCGKVALVATSRGMTGAGILAARAALRGGAGLVRLACPAGVNAVLEGALVEAITVPVGETSAGTVGAAALPALVELAAGADALLLGPGLGTHPETDRLVLDLVLGAEVPLVLDADGLNALARSGGGPEVLTGRGDVATVLTPHLGEAARLLGRPIEEVSRRRLEAARELARRSAAVVVLKGPHTLIADPGGAVAINLTGNPGLATGGSGDVLAGLIATCLARGAPAFSGAALAVYTHGRAADLAAAELGQASLLPSDLIEALPRVLGELRRETGPRRVTPALRELSC